MEIKPLLIAGVFCCPQNSYIAHMDSALDAVVPLFQTLQTFLLTTHVNPDGDGLGSELALAEWLISHGKQVTILNCSPTPAIFRFLDTHDRIRAFDPGRDAITIAGVNAIVVVDTNQLDRLQSMEGPVRASSAVKICIDHHLEPEPFAHHTVIDVDATSTGEILYHLLLRMEGSRLSPPIAQALYCAIMTDTGSFRYPRVDPEIHRIVARLIECGADPVSIYSQVYERWSPGRIRLLGEMLAGMNTMFDGRLAYTTITQAMLRHTDTLEEDTDNFTTYPMSVEGVIAGILFLELKQGIKISFRSKGEIPINELAKEFGGNGHKNAAGARVGNGSLEEIREKILGAAEKYIVRAGALSGRDSDNSGHSSTLRSAENA